jgi:hypothetical protein
MAALNFYQDFFEQLGKGNVDFSTDTFKIALSNTAPDATDTNLVSMSEIAAGNGYTTGGVSVADLQFSEAAGVGTVTADATVITASGGAIAQFRYYILIDSTNDVGVCWWDHGAAVDLADGETFTINFNDDATDGTILTIAAA